MYVLPRAAVVSVFQVWFFHSWTSTGLSAALHATRSGTVPVRPLHARVRFALSFSSAPPRSGFFGTSGSTAEAGACWAGGSGWSSSGSPAGKLPLLGGISAPGVSNGGGGVLSAPTQIGDV